MRIAPFDFTEVAEHSPPMGQLSVDFFSVDLTAVGLCMGHASGGAVMLS